MLSGLPNPSVGLIRSLTQVLCSLIGWSQTGGSEHKQKPSWQLVGSVSHSLVSPFTQTPAAPPTGLHFTFLVCAFLLMTFHPSS